MKVIIAGSRTVTNPEAVKAAIDASKFVITEVVCGMAKGADLLGRLWAQYNGIPVKEFPADWNLYGKKAGCLRNEQMAQYADALIAVWDGESRGTLNMINKAKKRNIPTYVHRTY